MKQQLPLSKRPVLQGFSDRFYTLLFMPNRVTLMKRRLRLSALIAASIVLGGSLQGCLLAAGTAAGAAGGYEAKKHGYDVQSPVHKDSAGGYKGQSPVVKHPQSNHSSSTTANGDHDSKSP